MSVYVHMLMKVMRLCLYMGMFNMFNVCARFCFVCGQRYGQISCLHTCGCLIFQTLVFPRTLEITPHVLSTCSIQWNESSGRDVGG